MQITPPIRNTMGMYTPANLVLKAGLCGIAMVTWHVGQGETPPSRSRVDQVSQSLSPVTLPLHLSSVGRL